MSQFPPVQCTGRVVQLLHKLRNAAETLGHIKILRVGLVENVSREAVRVVEIPNDMRVHLHMFYVCLVIHSVHYNCFHELFSKVVNSKLLSSKEVHIGYFKKYTALKPPVLPGQ